MITMLKIMLVVEYDDHNNFLFNLNIRARHSISASRLHQQTVRRRRRAEDGGDNEADDSDNDNQYDEYGRLRCMGEDHDVDRDDARY